MALTTSTQFLGNDSSENDKDHYKRKGGFHMSYGICIGFIVIAILSSIIVGITVYYLSIYVIPTGHSAAWSLDDLGHQLSSSRYDHLSSKVIPQYYRLKLRPFVENDTFEGEVSITLKTTTDYSDELILHVRDLQVRDVHLIEQKVNVITNAVFYNEENRNKRSPEVESNIDNENGDIALDTTVIAPVKNNELVEKSLNYTNEASATTDANFSIDLTDTSIARLDTNKSSTSLKRHDKHDRLDNELGREQKTYSTPRIIEISHREFDTRNNKLKLKLMSKMEPNVDYVLKMRFNGKLTDSLSGFYKSTYTDSKNEKRTLLTTQFEPIDARSAFPCFDEPAMKAKFEISIATPANMTVLSNMQVDSVDPMEKNPDWTWTNFKQSIKMSTYLVAYVICEFKSLNTTYLSSDNTVKDIKVWTRPELLQNAKYAAKLAPKLFTFYEKYFGMPYALPKMDLVAIPDFSAGAMENWGLSTFRETSLLLNESQNQPQYRYKVAVNLAHELAHQWFGNLVTMRWWTDLWLKEGFATYMEFIGVDHVEPNLNLLDKFTSNKMQFLKRDSMKHAKPLSMEVTDESMIVQKFDDTSYEKGASLLRMLNHTLTEKVFRDGIINYINIWQNANAEENDLWQAMASKSDNVTVVEFMNSWTKQAGYPLVNVTRYCDKNEIVFKQKLYSNSEPYAKTLSQLWVIPITFTTLSEPVDHWKTTPRAWLTSDSLNINFKLKCSDPLYVNIMGIGYYRVNYDRNNWKLLGRSLRKERKTLPPQMKAQILDDALNLARTGHLDYGTAFNLTTYLKDGEESKLVWDAVLGNLEYLDMYLYGTKLYGKFQDYMLKLVSRELASHNYAIDEPKNEMEALLVENLLKLECHAESPRCISWAQEQFKKWTTQLNYELNPIPARLRRVVYSTILRYGGRNEYNFLWKVYENTTDPAVKSAILTNLGKVSDASLLHLLLENSLTTIPIQYTTEIWNGMGIQCRYRTCYEFILSNWNRVYATYANKSQFLLPYVLKGAFGAISTDADLNRFIEFIQTHSYQLKGVFQTIEEVIDTAEVAIAWKQQHMKKIESWLENFLARPGLVNDSAEILIDFTSGVENTTKY